MYDTEGKSIMQVIKETRSLMKEKELENPKGKFRYLKRYRDCTALVTSDRNSNFYVSCLMELYGPFFSIKEAQKFRSIINLNSQAHQQAMWKSWEKDPMLS